MTDGRCYGQGRRLVINLGGQKFGSQILGGKNFLKIYFKKKSLKVPFNCLKNSDDFFLVIENFFSKKCTLFIEIYFLFFVLFFLSLCFCFLSCLFFFN